MEVEFISLAVIAVVAAVVPLVANRIPKKLVPETVLLLIAGAALGPHALGLVHLTDSVNLLSELGMAFLFLLAGYEIDPKNLTGRAGRISVLTWVVSFAIASVLTLALAGVEVGNIGAIAASVALTTTAIGTLMPILAERSVLGTRVGDLVLSFGTYGEIMPILAIALLMTTRAKWVTVVILLAFAAFSVFVGWRGKSFRRVGNRAYEFLVDRAAAHRRGDERRRERRCHAAFDGISHGRGRCCHRVPHAAARVGLPAPRARPLTHSSPFAFPFASRE